MSDTVAQSIDSPIVLPDLEEHGIEYMWIETPKDINNVGIVDKAKQLPLKPIFVLQAVSVYRFTRHLANYTDANWRDQNNTLNSGGWRSWAAGEAWCSCYPESLITPLNVNNVDCYRVHYVVKCLRGGWKTKIPEAGYVYLDGSDLKDWLTADNSITIGKLTDAGGKAGASAALLVTDWDTKRSVGFSFLPS